MAASKRQSFTNPIDLVNALLKATNSNDELYSDHQQLTQAINSPASEEGSILRTIAHIGGKYGTETGQNANFTTDEEIVMELLREQIEEYKESFFRVNRTLQQKMNMI